MSLSSRSGSARRATAARSCAAAATMLLTMLLTVLVPFAPDGAADVRSSLHIDAGSATGYVTKLYPLSVIERDVGGRLHSLQYLARTRTRYVGDRGFIGGSNYAAASTTAIAGTGDDELYRTSRVGMTAYRLAVPSPARYRVDLHLVELQTSGRGKRVFDVLAEGRVVLRNVDVYAQNGRYFATRRTFDVPVDDGTLNLEFRWSSALPAAVSGISLTRSGTAGTGAGVSSPEASPPVTAPAPLPSVTAPAPVPSVALPTSSPTATAGPTTPTSSEFPSRESTGPRVPMSSLEPSSGITSSHDGQVIEQMDVTGNIVIRHDNVTVRDSRISFTRTYGLTVTKKADGSCPVGALFEYVDVDGRLAAENDIPVYSSGCAWTLDRAYVHNVGRTSRMTNDNTVSNSYIHSNRTGSSGAHRGAVGTNGGRNNRIINNVLLCEGKGCSAAIPMYGDFSPVDGMLVQHNLIATTGSYCAYGGSISGKKYPHGSNIRFIDNHFSTRFSPNCGRYGHISGFAGGVRGNEWRGNVWHETGKPA